MANYQIRITQMMVLPDDEPIFSENATSISIADDGAGEFIVLSQNRTSRPAKVGIDKEEWQTLADAISKMFEQCR